MNLFAIIIPILVSAVLTALMVPLVIRLSYRKKWFDSINERTVHKGSVPRLGGSAFVLSAGVAMACAINLSDIHCLRCVFFEANDVMRSVGLLGAILIIYLSGVLDDIRTLNYKYKFLSQFLSAGLIVFVGGFWIGDFGGLFGMFTLSPLMGKVLSAFIIISIVNAFNLIDGIDGLASSLGIVATLVLGFSLLSSGQVLVAVLSFVMTASLIVFFCYNKFGNIENKTKIFMGDGGSQTMGLIIAFLIVFVSMQGDVQRSESLPQSLVMSFSLIIVPCFDLVRVMVDRMRRHQNPFLADKTHIHHKFMRIGCGQTTTLLAILALDGCLIGMNYLLMTSDIDIPKYIMINVVVVLDLVLWSALHLWLDRLIDKAEAYCHKE